MKDPLGVSPSKGNQGTTRGKQKILLTSVGIEPTTSGLDLPLLCRLSYEFEQRKSGTIEVCSTTFICTLSLRCNSPPKLSPTFFVRIRSSAGRVTVDLIRRSWVRIPPRSKEFFFTSCDSLIPFTRANAQWVFNGFHIAL